MDTSHPNYLVVARRYRPQTFPELIGQHHVAQALTGAIASDRVGHAYLFTGARGVGKTSAARILAKALNCADGTSPTPCGRCEICVSVAAGDDVDVLEIDGASNRGIDEIRQLRQNAAIRPSRARYKIYIIDEVHMLTKEAFNALLKTLEEPPEHVKFIFATTEPNKIPITILSRCQRYDFAGIESHAIAHRLAEIAAAEGVAIESEALQILALRAAGSMRDSQSLLEQLLAVGAKQITAADVSALLGLAPAARLGELVQALVQREPARALTHLDAALADGTEVGQLLDQLLGYFRDAMTLAVGCDASRMLYAAPGQRDEVAACAREMGLQTVLAAAQILDQTAARMRVSTQARTLTEMALVRIATLGDLQSLANLVEQMAGDDGDTSAPAVKKNIPAKIALSPSQDDAPPSPRLSPAEQGKSPGGDVASLDGAALWQATVAELTGMVAEQAAAATRITIDANGDLVASFPEMRRFSRDSCQRAASHAKISAALANASGRPMRVRFDTHPDADEPRLPLELRVSRREQEENMASQPFVQRAIALFDVDATRLRIVAPNASGENGSAARDADATGLKGRSAATSSSADKRPNHSV